jgi:hypothetical protein
MPRAGSSPYVLSRRSYGRAASSRRSYGRAALSRRSYGRAAYAAAIAVTLFGCAGAESEIEPRVPVDALRADPMQLRAPDISDGFPDAFAAATRDAPRPRLRRSISLGFIGDSPLGREPSPPHQEPYWARPFPCHWDGTCRVIVLVPR